jgi:hypothetical protein
MNGGTGFKIVAVVAVLSIAAVMVIDKYMLDGAFSSFSVFGGNEAVPTNVVTEAPDKKKDLRIKAAAAKRPMTVTKEVAEPAIAGDTPRAIEIPVKSNDPRQGVTPGMNRAQVLKLFGEPTLRVTETHDRKVIERLIYVDAKGHSRTIAILENGRAVRSYSAAYFGVNSAKAER